MRESVLKQRKDCDRTFMRKSGDFPLDFERVWHKRKVCEYGSRKNAGFGVYLLMKSKVEVLNKYKQAYEILKEANEYYTQNDFQPNNDIAIGAAKKVEEILEDKKELKGE